MDDTTGKYDIDWHAPILPTDARTELAAAHSEIERLREALRKYGKHSVSCKSRVCRTCRGTGAHPFLVGGEREPHIRDPHACNCGFAAVLLNEEEKK